MNSTKSAVGLMNSRKNKLNNKISGLFNLKPNTRFCISCTRYICRVPHKEVDPTMCESRLLVRYLAYMPSTRYTASKHTCSLPNSLNRK